MMSARGVIAAGNWIVDIVHEIANWPRMNDLTRILHETHGIGGGAANVITALARFNAGLPLTPVGAIGDDVHGDFVLEHCRLAGLSTDYILRKPGISTAHTHVMSVPGDSRTFFYHGGANDLFSAEDVPDTLLSPGRARIFYLGYLLLLGALDRLDDAGQTPARALLARARAAGMLTCVDLVSADRPDFADIVGAALPEIDCLVINEAEASRATGIPTTTEDGTPDAAGFEAAARALFDKGVQRSVVLHSPQLTLWLDQGAAPLWAHPEPVPPERIVSPVGAGDAFCAGVLYALHEGWRPDRALALANRSAAACLGGHTATDAIPPIAELVEGL